MALDNVQFTQYFRQEDKMSAGLRTRKYFYHNLYDRNIYETVLTFLIRPMWGRPKPGYMTCPPQSFLLGYHGYVYNFALLN